MKNFYHSAVPLMALLCASCQSVQRTDRKPQEPRVGLVMFKDRLKRLMPDPAQVNTGARIATTTEDLLLSTGIDQSKLATARANSVTFSEALKSKFENSMDRSDFINVFTNRAQFANQFVSKGQLIPTDSVGEYKQFSGDHQLQTYVDLTEEPYQVCGVMTAKGSGKGWITDEFFHGLAGCCDDEERICSKDYRFSFIPAFTAVYTLEATVLVGGPYYLLADDGITDSKEAKCEIRAQMGLEQRLSGPVEISPGVIASGVFENVNEVIFSDGDDNIEVNDRLFAIKKFVLSVPLYTHNTVDVSVAVDALIYAKGEGSFAYLDLSKNQGGIWCFRLTVYKGPPR